MTDPLLFPIDAEPDQPRDREGLFDMQMSFPEPFAAPLQPVTVLLKRDGRETPFDKARIARAINRAAESIGLADNDRAMSMASAVTIFLAKAVRGARVTSEQVNDAVERVLLVLGQGETALAYARYRDRRDRIRQLREGNLQDVLHELRQAREESGGSFTRDLAVSVHTSKETITAWDRERIVEALVRETQLDPGTAELIAIEVEDQIAAAHLRTLTASLIRELVDTRLIEHGLEEHRRRHARLGVPLYDAERTICLPNRDEPAQAHNPLSTDLELAARVKREFALTRIFDEEIAEAHMRGDIHIHDLEYVDRLQECRPSLAHVARFGLPASAGGLDRPPRHADALLLDIAAFSGQLRRHFSGALSWRWANTFLAPCLQSASDDALRAFAQLFIIGLTHQTPGNAAPAGIAAIELAWHIPAFLAEINAPGVDRPYGGFLDSARRAAMAITEVYLESGFWERPTEAPRLSITLSSSSLETPHILPLLIRALELARTPSGLDITLAREDAPEPIWGLHDCVAGQVSLNLPRLAYDAADVNALLDGLDRLMGVAVKAHQARHAFITRLLGAQSLGPLAFLTRECEQERLFDLSAATWVIGLAGLEDAAAFLTGEGPESGGVRELCLRITRHAAGLARDHGARLQLPFTLGPSSARQARQRLASLDARAYPEQIRRVLQASGLTGGLIYTTGGALPTASAATPLERLRMEGAYHPIFGLTARTTVHLPADDLSPQALITLLRQALHLTTIERLTLAQ